MSMKLLLKDGWTIAGSVVLTPSHVEVRAQLPAVGGNYAFITDDGVGYIGTTGNLRARVRSYGYCHVIPFANANRTVHNKMLQALRAGKKVTVLIYTACNVRLPNGRVVNAAEGHEAVLIAELRPAWNVLRSKRRDEWAGTPISLIARKAAATRAAARAALAA